MSTDLARIGFAAADLIDRTGWTQGVEKNAAGRVCLTGALRWCDPQPGDDHLAVQVWARWGYTPGWNDRHGRTAEDVTGVLRREVTDADLEETFGPQWEQLVALVRQVATLTLEQINHLAAARDAALDAALGAAWDAARDAARDAAWGAARDAAWGAARDAARVAALGAARALFVRDLIGQHGFTAEHYRTLTAPWVSVMGPLHPADPPADTDLVTREGKR